MSFIYPCCLNYKVREVFCFFGQNIDTAPLLQSKCFVVVLLYLLKGTPDLGHRGVREESICFMNCILQMSSLFLFFVQISKE